MLAIILISLLASSCNGHRVRRYLVYPDGGPARAQFIIGLGVPVDLKDASVTVGTVIKFQYDLPTNSSEYTSRIYGFANTVSRDMNGESPEDEANKIDVDDIEDSRKIDDVDNLNYTSSDNDTLVDITFDNRRKRALAYSEGGIEYTDLKINTELPLEEAIKKQEMIDQNSVDEEPQRMNRWDFYKILEHMAERYGYTGRPCLLRTICEAAEVPFTHENGLLGEIGHILFTKGYWRYSYASEEASEAYESLGRPSTTKDTLSHHTDNEYHAAERMGRDIGVDCESLFPECEGSVLNTFTQIGEDTLHKFGFF